jgi:hypothetical protein
MSSTSNVQSYLPYVFRPVYTWTGSNFSTSFNISNVDTISVNTATFGRLSVGDSNLNVYVGSNAGNVPSNATAFITYCNTAVGTSAGAGISNASNSEFVGYLAGNSGKSVFNSILVGMNAGGLGATTNSISNIYNSILIGTCNATGLSNISNTISIGGNSSGGGTSNIFIGTSNGFRTAGSSNIIIGNGVFPTISTTFTASLLSTIVTCTTPTPTNIAVGDTLTIAGLVPTGFNGSITVLSVPSTTTFTYSNTTPGPLTSNAGTATGTSGTIPNYSDANKTTYTVSTSISNKFFLGSGSNIIAAGDFANGVFVVGSTNTNSWSCNSGIYATSNISNISLDVYKYARFQNGISIGRDPGAYTLDVNGQFRITDGLGWIAMSNSNSPGQSNSFVEIKPAPGISGTMTLQLTGNMTVSSNITASNVVATNAMTAVGYSTFQSSSFLTLSATMANTVAPSTPGTGFVTYTTTAAHGFSVGQTVVIASGSGFSVGYTGITGVIVGFGTPPTTTFYIANATTGGTTTGTGGNIAVVYAAGTAKNGLLQGTVFDTVGVANYHIVSTIVRSVGTAYSNTSTIAPVGALSCTVYSNTPPVGSGLPANSITFSNTTGTNLTVGYNFTQFPTS